MSEIKVIYWSQTGNTEEMAKAIANGIKEGGAEVKLTTVDEISVEEVAKDSVVVLGCPAMGAEELEDGEMEPFMQELEGHLSGKQVALFGSYGWGDGEWMRTWEERVTNAGGKVVENAGLIINETPDEDGLKDCELFGKTIASL